MSRTISGFALHSYIKFSDANLKKSTNLKNRVFRDFVYPESSSRGFSITKFTKLAKNDNLIFFVTFVIFACRAKASAAAGELRGATDPSFR